MQAIRYVNYLLAFGLELVLFFSVSYWGYTFGKSTLTKWVVAVALFIIVVTLWGVFAAPKSSMRVSFPWLNLVKILLFSLGTFAFWGIGKTRIAVIYSILCLVSVIISYFDETNR